MRTGKWIKLYIVIVALFLAAALSLCGLFFRFGYEEIYRFLALNEPRCEEADGCFAFFNVGNGDCSAVYTDEVIGLIDTGTPDYARSLVNQMKTLTDSRLDFVVISHPHDDHAGGYEYLLEHFTVDRLYIRSYTKEQLEDYSYYQRLLSVSREKGVEVIHPDDRSAVQIEELRLSFYSPVFYTEDENERCLLTLATVGEKRCLYTGDCGYLTEDVLIQRGYDINADILKVGHHGSKTATSPGFLQAVSPVYAAICVGYNNYGHPTDQVTGLLTNSGIVFYRTDIFDKIVFSVTKNQIITDLE